MISFNYDTSEAAVRQIAQDIVGNTYPVIFARQNTPRPQTDYITIDTVSVRPIGRAEQIYDEDNVDRFKIIQDVSVTMMFIAVGKQSRNLLAKLDLHLTGGNPAILDRLMVEAGLAPQGKANQLDTTALLETGYEPRAAMDVVFNGSLIDDNVDLGVIESVVLDEIIYEAASPHGDGDVQWTSNLTVEPYLGG